MRNKLLYLFVLAITASFSQIKTEEILLKNDGIELPGTLTYSNKKSPLVIWVHGSGNVDRNGNQGGIIKANYIQQIREKLNRNNIAFYSFDKRTANPKNTNLLKGVVFDDFVKDVKIAINHFKNEKRFSKIILIGHSQGSLTAMLAAKNIDKYISLAGLSESFDKTMIWQISKQNKALGKIAEAHFKELFENKTIAKVNPYLVSIFKEANYPFLINWAKYNPTQEIQNLRIPSLIINGTKDIQVRVSDAKSLHRAHTTSELFIIENMNHVLKHIEVDSDNMKSYYSADFPISSELIPILVNFIKK